MRNAVNDPLIKLPRLLTGQLCIIELFAWGVLYYTFSVFLPDMEKELGWPSAVLSGGYSLSILVSGLVAPFVGSWIDRNGSRELMLTGSIVGAVGVGVWSVSYSVATYYVAWFLIGLAMAATLYAPAFATVVRITQDNSRSAIMVITLVGALASTVFMPLSALLGDWHGWRTALVLLALALAAITIPLSALLPQATNFQGENSSAGRSSERQKVPPPFVVIAAALMISDAASVAVNVYLVTFLQHQGQTLQAAALIAGLAGAAKIGGRVATIVEVSSLKMLSAAMAIKSATLLLPLVWSNTWCVVLMVVGFGATSGAQTILRPSIVVELFGSKGFGKNNGVLQLLTTLSKAIGPIGFGIVLSIVGWTFSWAAISGALVISFSLLLNANSRMKDSEAKPQEQ